MAYSDKVLEHYENPRNVGKLDKDSPNVGHGMVGAPACGDVLSLMIEVDDNDKIIDAKFKTYGCGSAIASSSELVDMLLGKTLEEAKEIKNKDIADALDLPPIKLHCSVLAEESIHQAVKDYESKL
ncbi:MAG: Fe-S cluster assembly scaffold IscU [SAR86 cluster bacterium]|nr:Fe-S cluster assembly scaffold IscU [SAR86 cluster bacterium]